MYDSYVDVKFYVKILRRGFALTLIASLHPCLMLTAHWRLEGASWGFPDFRGGESWEHDRQRLLHCQWIFEWGG
jgi:hypothetical protein